MKKKGLKLAAFLFVATMSFGLVSCGDEDPITPTPTEKPDESGTGGNDEPGTGDDDKPGTGGEEGKAMTPLEQKEYLEKVALEFMNMVPSSDFSEIADLGNYINDTYGEDYDWDGVGDWAENTFDALCGTALGTTTENDGYSYDSNRYDYNTGTFVPCTYNTYFEYIYTDYKAVLMASNFTGHFTARDGSWVREDANDLQFIFKDKQVRQCVLKLETGGNVKKVHLLDVEDWNGWDYNHTEEPNGNGYISNTYYKEYCDRYQLTIGVPENITITLTQGSNQVVKTTLKFDLNNISGEEFDLSKHNLTMSAEVILNNGYRLDVSKVAYTANTSASVAFAMSKNGKALITMGVSSEVTGLPSVNVSAFTAEDDDEWGDFDDANGKNAYVKFDIIGKVQMQGKLTDGRKFADYMEKAEDNDTKETAYKSWINQANGLFDVNMYYNNTSTKQAYVELEPFAEEYWNGERYWDVEPVMKFYDGTSYSTFEAFFNDTDFKKTIDTFKKLANKFADLVDERIDW